MVADEFYTFFFFSVLYNQELNENMAHLISDGRYWGAYLENQIAAQ